MSLWEAILLGILQGLTEFLPVSSSGHLELAGDLFGVGVESNLSFAMALHGGTVLSTVVVFRAEIGRLLRGVLGFRLNTESIYGINLLISMLPVVFVGLFFRERIEGLFGSDLVLVGAMLIVTAALLAFSHFAKPGNRPITPSRAFLIGIAQALAVVPGLSRSGATISTGLLLGVEREQVARFSFLMVLVPIIGINMLDLVSGDWGGGMLAWPLLLGGFLAAFVTGTLACRWMIRLVARGKLLWFAGYCALVGIVAIASM